MEPDLVNHPPHYQSKDGSGIECIDAIRASMSLSEFQGYLRGNIMKYIFRTEDKNGLEDLKKAEWYLNRLIQEIEENS